jgi:hypothetical protein
MTQMRRRRPQRASGLADHRLLLGGAIAVPAIARLVLAFVRRAGLSNQFLSISWLGSLLGTMAAPASALADPRPWQSDREAACERCCVSDRRALRVIWWLALAVPYLSVVNCSMTLLIWF